MQALAVFRSHGPGDSNSQQELVRGGKGELQTALAPNSTSHYEPSNASLGYSEVCSYHHPTLPTSSHYFPLQASEPLRRGRARRCLSGLCWIRPKVHLVQNPVITVTNQIPQVGRLQARMKCNCTLPTQLENHLFLLGFRGGCSFLASQLNSIQGH